MNEELQSAITKPTDTSVAVVCEPRQTPTIAA